MAHNDYPSMPKKRPNLEVLSNQFRGHSVSLETNNTELQHIINLLLGEKARLEGESDENAVGPGYLNDLTTTAEELDLRLSQQITLIDELKNLITSDYDNPT